MPNVAFQVSDGIQIGTAQITASGNAIVLPSGTSVGNVQVATSSDVSTGGGPKITNLQITDGSWSVLDDTAVDIVGGNIVITGTNFVAGCLVYFNQTPANSVGFVSATSLRVTVPALTAGTYIVYVINPDGGTAIRVPGLTASASPAWQTGSSLAEQYDGVLITLSLVATDATSYTLTSGSLPPGLSLASNTGVITGTVTGVTVDTTYTFTVRATDAQLQDSPRTFTITITVSDPYFRLTTLLLGGEQGNTVVRDSSVNNFNLTVNGDSRASNFTPYGTAWSVYFDGNGDYLSIANNAALTLGTSDFTIEMFIYWSGTNSGNAGNVTFIGTEWSGSSQAGKWIFYFVPSTGIIYFAIWNTNIITATTALVQNRWYHLALTRSGTSFRLFIDGLLNATGTSSLDANSGFPFYIGLYYDPAGGPSYGYFPGYLSNLRVLKGTALYTANFTPATTTLTSVANTSLLTCHVNSFRDGSTNNFTVTRNGDAAVRSFNPFNLTNTGDSGSMYFDGTGDYVTAPFHASEYNFGTGNFTIQAWFYIDTDKTIAGANGGMIFDYQFENFQLYYVNSPSYLYCDIRNWGTNIGLQSTTQMRQGQWYHAAIIRDGVSSVKMYINGVLESTSTTNPGSINFNTYNLYIGVRYNPSGGALDYYHKGYISNYRITNNAVTAGNLLTDSTAITGTKLSTLQFKQPHNNHGFQDSSANQFLITRNGNATQGTFSPFSQTGWSTYLYDGLIQASMSTNGQFGTGDFTVDIWVYPQSGSQSTGNVIWSFAQYPNGIFITYNNDGTISVFSNGATRITGGAGTLTFNSWSHIAVSRSSAALRLFLNGSQIGITYTDSSNYTQGFYGIGRPDDVASYYYRGYLSNFRVVKGTALYTANFTPSTTSLTAVANTQLLTLQSNRYRDNSTNNYAVTVSGTYSIQAFSPFAPTAVYTPAVHGGSLYLDGTGDWLTIANNPAFDMTSSSYCFEAWLYPTSSNELSIFNRFDGQGGPGLSIQRLASASSRIIIFYSGTQLNGVTAVNENTWTHIACTFDGTTKRIFINGALDASTTSGTMWQNSSTNTEMAIGNRPSDNRNFYFSGFMSGVRIAKGTAIYTAAFTPPTTPSTATTNTQLLLNFTDAAIIDRTGRNAIETVADAKTSSVQVKYGTGAMYFDGTGDYLVVPSSLLHLFGTQAFTVEAWVYTTSTKQYQHIYGTHNGDTNWIVRLLDNKIMMYTGSGDITGSTVLSINTWYHVAAVREGTGTNQTKLYVNGNLDVTGTNATNYTTQSQAWIGAQINNPGLTYFQGYIDDLRITRFARYTANFTPPTGSHRLK